VSACLGDAVVDALAHYRLHVAGMVDDVRRQNSLLHRQQHGQMDRLLLLLLPMNAVTFSGIFPIISFFLAPMSFEQNSYPQFSFPSRIARSNNMGLLLRARKKLQTRKTKDGRPKT
jgi:hypothetical protein